MSNATAAAPARATKTPARTTAAPAPAQDAKTPAALETGAITTDEALVVATMAKQLQAIYATHGAQLSAVCSELLHTAADSLENPQEGHSAIYKAAALVYGAISVERADRPGSPAIAPLEVVHQSLDSASISYSFEQAGCEAMADGIRAGQRQFRDRPASPIRRVEDASQGPYNQAQLFTVLTEVASVALTLSDVLAVAGQSKDEWQMRTLIDSANVHARLLGAMADTASGCNMRGDHDAWIYGPNFADEGKAGAA